MWTGIKIITCKQSEESNSGKAGFAVSDEFHQLFVPGRSGNIKDVFIDTAGSVSGILLVWLTGWLR